MEAGASVVIVGTKTGIQELAEQYRGTGYACQGLVADLGSRDGAEKAYRDAVALLQGPPDILVNAAGVQRRHPAEAFPMEDWDTVMAVNLEAVFILCQLAGRDMLAKGRARSSTSPR
jgi:2-deoxy-D-gluconate 3-dehydrogenase